MLNCTVLLPVQMQTSFHVNFLSVCLKVYNFFCKQGLFIGLDYVTVRQVTTNVGE